MHLSTRLAVKDCSDAGCLMDLQSGLSHYLDAITRGAQEIQIVSTGWVLQALHGLNELLSLVMVSLNQAWSLDLTNNSRWAGNSLLRLLHEDGLLAIACLALSALGWP